MTVKRVQLTEEQMKAAIQRAEENKKYHAVWVDKVPTLTDKEIDEWRESESQYPDDSWTLGAQSRLMATVLMQRELIRALQAEVKQYDDAINLLSSRLASVNETLDEIKYEQYIAERFADEEPTH